MNSNCALSWPFIIMPKKLFSFNAIECNIIIITVKFRKKHVKLLKAYTNPVPKCSVKLTFPVRERTSLSTELPYLQYM